MKKALLTAEQLISHMDNKGIQFNIVNKEEAKTFLENNNYYKKLSSYRKNYLRAPNKYCEKKYQNLDFAYLQELSRIDLRLRYLIIHMCLDIEHAMKIEILNNAIKLGDDGFSIVENFLRIRSKVRDNINMHASSSYCRNLIANNQDEFPIWVFLEIISFGDLCVFYSYFSKCHKKLEVNTDVLFSVRSLRNAAAHSHCLINDLRKGKEKPNSIISDYIAEISDITKSSRKSRLKNHFINDFVSMIYSYDIIVKSDGAKKHTYSNLRDLFDKRMLRHANYFRDNEIIKNSYIFCKKVLDKIINENYTV